MKKRAKTHQSFTLIEMLVVMLIIGILAGILFRLSRLSKAGESKAKTLAVLEKVAGALEEYRSEYGVYPPVQPGACTVHSGCRICYQYETTNISSMSEHLNKIHFVDPANAEELNFEYGLVSYLTTRKKGCMNDDHLNNPNDSDDAWIGDTARDKKSKGKWTEFMEGVVSSGDGVMHQAGEQGNLTFTNNVDTIKDGWGDIIHYISDPPYTSYELWSNGPNGISGDDDDIHRDSM